MSLPLTRRIAKTVLLTAAGAASVVGTAGAASAAELPTTDVGGLSHPDNSVGSAAAQGVKKLSPMSSSPVSTASDTASSGVDAASSDANRVAPKTRKFAGNTADGANEGLQGQAPNVRTLPAGQLQGQQAHGRTAEQQQPQPAAEQQRPLGSLDKTLPTKGLVGGKVLPNGLGSASVAGL